MKKQITTAFVLGAGLGTRLRPLTDDCPKPLLSVGGRPIISYVFDHLLTVGIERIIVNTHHRAEKYAEFFPDEQWKGVPIVFRHEPELLETAGGLKNIEDLIAKEENILLYNGDVITDLPLERLITHHFSSDNEVTLTLRSKGGPLQVGLDEKGCVADIAGKLERKGLKKYLFTGLYVVNRRFLERVRGAESVIVVFLRMLEARDGKIGGIVLDEGRWHDVGTVPEYERMNDYLDRPLIVHPKAEKR